MVYRMADYFIMLLRRYKLPVHQYVIYVGAGMPRMTDKIVSKRMHFSFALIVLSEIDYNLLLTSDVPEEKMLAILANLGKGNQREAIETIVNQVIEDSQGEFSKLRRIKQMRILSQLRNLAPENLAIMDDLTGFFTVEKDIFYKLGEKKGLEKGIEKSKAKLVRNLLLNTDFTIRRIAALVDVKEYFVRKIKKTLK